MIARLLTARGQADHAATFAAIALLALSANWMADALAAVIMSVP